ncbi:MAG: hypothetical protein H0V72_08390 [Bradyrhizobium sp.]|nr:hypothetical protein [Bradyrhizobium sp.]
MSKFWVMGGAIMAVSVAVMAWNTQPVRSSESLLSKAQSEFAMKARDALMQRYMAQSATASAAAVAPKSTALLPYAVASLEPVAAPMVVARKTSLEAIAPQPQTVTVAPLDAPIAMQEVAPPPPVALPDPSADGTPATKMQIASLPDEPQMSLSPKPIAEAAPVSELAKADRPIVTPTSVAPRRQTKAAHNTRHKQEQPITNTVVHRSKRTASRTLTPRDLESLRARSPELAAAIARYM